jgi:hypothetical protein
MDGMLVHRLAAVAWFGYDEVAENKVHHQNGVKWDNREENLAVMSDSDHKSHHANEWGRDEKGRFDFRSGR